MKKVGKQKIALTTGILFGGVHLVWSLMIAMGFAQTYLDWIMGLHSINNPFFVMEFSLERTIYLVSFTFVVGYVVGWVGAWVCNKTCRK